MIFYNRQTNDYINIIIDVGYYIAMFLNQLLEINDLRD